MRLFQNKVSGKLVVVGEKNVYGLPEMEIIKRGYKFLIAFNSAWDGVQHNENIEWITNYDDAKKWLKKTPLTEENRVKKELLELRKMIKKLENPTP